MKLVRMSDSERWAQLKKRGFWRHILMEGVMLFGLPFFLVCSGVTWWLDIRGEWKHDEQWVVVLLCFVGGLVGGFIVGLFYWALEKWLHSRAEKGGDGA